MTQQRINRGGNALATLPATLSRVAGCLALAGLSTLAACQRHDATSPAVSTDSAASSPSPDNAASALASIQPKSSDVTASGSTPAGPADATTAVGGLAGNQDSGGARPGSKPQPTGGDGAASSSAR